MKINESDIQKLLKSAYLQINQGNFEKTISIIESQLEENSKNPNLYNLLSLSFFNIGKFDHSIKSFHEGLINFPNNFHLNNNFSVVLKEIKDFEKALLYGLKAFKIDPSSDEVSTNLGKKPCAII